ncbi:MAG: LacI family DNA-binding transcriptional regulator [Victivallales bacterium]|nr:LacI family DNA-binding transcriptional regulator [Victivallales bacterium]
MILKKGVFMVTMQDIAEKAGVNKGTVSYVLNGKYKQARIGLETCDRIMTIAHELGYRRNELAYSVATGKSNVIAFVSCISDCEYISRIMFGILEEISRHGYSLKVFHLVEGNSSEITEQIICQRIEGVIFHSASHIYFQSVFDEVSKNNIPCTVANLSGQYSECGITTNDYQGTKDAVKHLVDLGHRRIAYISHLSSCPENLEYVVNREAGYMDGMKEFIGVNSECRIERVEPHMPVNTTVLRKLLVESADRRPTAIICISEPLAMKLMQEAYLQEIKLPDELSIIGFADLEMAKLAIVPLTTIAQPFNLIGQESAKMLLEKIQNKNPETSNKIKKLETKLVIRESTAPPAKSK